MHSKSGGVISAAVAAILGVVASAQALAVNQFDLPAQSLGDSIRAVASQTNTNLLFDPERVAGLKAPALKAEVTTEEAIQRLVKESGLEVTVLNERTIVLGERGRKGKETAGREGNFWKGFRVAEVGESNASEVKEEKKDDLSEIVVTATKREERIQDVPMSITAITSEEIDRRGLVSAADYLRGIPGVSQADSNQGQAVVIRGMATDLRIQNFGAGSTVAQYFGETPTTGSAGLLGGSNVDVKLVDIERVEVLRGPQGTAFGNASMGGAVRVIPKAPKLDAFESKVSAGYSGTSGTGGDNYNVHGVVNLPLIGDKLALRATAYRYEESGFYSNRAGSDPALQAAAAAFGVQAFAVDAREVGAASFTGGRVAALFQPTDALRVTLTYLAQKTETDGMGVATSNAYEQGIVQVAPEHVVRGQKLGVFDTDIDVANATMEYALGWADLLATYSYIDSGSTSAFAGGLFGGVTPDSFKGENTHRGHVGEMRLSTNLEGKWNFLGGLYADDLEDDSPAENVWFGSPETNPYFPGQQGVYTSVHRRRDDKQKAGFVEASWEFMPRFKLTAGARFYDYERTRRDARSGFFGTGSTRFDTKASGSTFRGNLSYKVTEDALIYAGWSQGFRLGQPIGAGLAPETCDIDRDGIVDGTDVTMESTTHVDSDDVNNYELGGKFTMLERRLSIAIDAYRMDWNKLPITVLAPCQRLYLANAGTARSEGVEFQTSFQVSEPLSVDAGAAYVRARLTEGVPAQGWLAGNRLPGAPELNASVGMQYMFNLGAYRAYVRGDTTYVGTFYGNVQETERTKSGGYVKVDFSARLSIRDTNVDLFVRNLTNVDKFAFRGVFPGGSESFGYLLRPRTIGIQLSHSF